MPDYSVKTTISAIDKATEVVRGVGSAFSRLLHPIKAVNEAVAEPKTTALGKVGSAVDGVASKFRSGLGSITSWVPALGAIGTAASLSGLVSMTKKAAEGYEGAALAAKKLGVSSGDLAVWRFAAKLVNVESEQLEKGLLKLNKTTYDAATGKNKDVALLYQRMGISMLNAKGKVKGVDESLEDIAEAFKRTENAATRDAMAIALFGKSGAELLPFLVKGRAGITDLRAEMKKFSGLSAEHRNGLGELAESYKYLDKAGSGLSTRLSAGMAPIISKVVNRITDWIVANREFLGQAMDRRIAKIETAVRYVGMAFTAVMSIPFISQMLAGISKTDVFTAGISVLGLTLAGPVFAAISTVTLAIGRMTAAMLSNPYLAAGALLVGTAIELVKHWDEAKAAVSEAFEKWGTIGAVFQTVNVGVNLVFAAINDLTKALFGLDLDKWGKSLERVIDDMVAATLKRLQEWVAVFEKIWAPIGKAIDFVGGGVKTLNAPATPAFTDSVGAAALAGAGGYAFQPGSPAAASPPAQRVTGQLDINITGAPPGTTAAVANTGAVKLNPNVGYSMLPPGLGHSY